MLNTQYLRQFKTEEEWLKARQTTGIGASEVPAILGLSRFDSPLSLYSEKLGLTSRSAKYAESARWGKILEAPIAERYTAEVGRTLAPAQPFSFYVNPKYPHALASIDRFINGVLADSPVVPYTPGPLPAPLEIKNVHFVMRDQWSEESNNEPPVEYQVQCQYQMAVTGLPWCSIAGLIGGFEFKWADMKRDDALIEKIMASVDEFWFRLLKRDPPRADELEATSDVLKALYPKDNGQTVSLGVDALEWAGELERAKEARKALDTEIDKYSNLLKQAIGDNTAALLPDGSLYTHKWQKRDGYEVKPTEYRVLRPKKASGR